jgi:hypothetical protein
MRDGLAPYIQSAPSNSDIVLIDTGGGGLKYSVYLLQGFDVLEFGAEKLGDIYGRPDVNVRIARTPEDEENRGGRQALLLHLVGNMPEPLATKSATVRTAHTTSAMLDSRSLNKR